MSLIDSSYYGAVPAVQPTGEAGAQPMPEATAPARTTPVAGKTPLFAQPGFWVVAIVAVAIGLIHVSIRFA